MNTSWTHVVLPQATTFGTPEPRHAALRQWALREIAAVSGADLEQIVDQLLNMRSGTVDGTSFENGRRLPQRVERLSLARMRREDQAASRTSGEVKLSVSLDDDLADY